MQIKWYCLILSLSILAACGGDTIAIDSENNPDTNSEHANGQPSANPSPSTQASPLPSPSSSPSAPITTVLQKGVTSESFSGTSDEAFYFLLHVPEGASQLRINVSSLNGNPDMHMKFGRQPTMDDYDCQPRSAGQSEDCELDTVEAGNYYVMITSESQFENAVVSADYQRLPLACEPSTSDRELLTAHNQARAVARHCGERFYEAVAPLSWSCELGAAALAHSIDMAENNYFAHTGLDGSKPWDRAQRHGYRSQSVGENIAAGYGSVANAMEGWLKSAGHCANIMNGTMTELGTGVYRKQGSTYSDYWTALLGRPR